GDAIRRDDDFQVRANVAVYLVETLAEIFVIVKRQIARMGIQREGAQRAAEAGQFQEQFLGMAALGDELVAQRRQRGVYGMQQPEIGNLARGELGVSRASAL